jgi:serine phosphatase RsbU (regulator of sigma subunit)
MGRVETQLVVLPLTGLMEECGDTGVIVSDETRCFVALVDVLGHGREARASAAEAEDFLPSYADEDLAQALNGLHERLRRGRGAVATLCRLDLAGGGLEVSGVGNISTRLFGDQHVRVVSRDGIVGYSMSSPRVQRFRMLPGDVLLLHSDGVREAFDRHDCPGLLTGSALDICERVLREYRKADDDASCLVLRYLP